MKLKKMEIVMILTLILCMAFHFLSFAGGCQNIKKDVLRLHILASSDTAADQALKLKVRDAVLKQGYAVFDGAKTVDEAKLKVRKNLEEHSPIGNYLRIYKQITLFATIQTPF